MHTITVVIDDNDTLALAALSQLEGELLDKTGMRVALVCRSTYTPTNQNECGVVVVTSQHLADNLGGDAWASWWRLATTAVGADAVIPIAARPSAAETALHVRRAIHQLGTSMG